MGSKGAGCVIKSLLEIKLIIPNTKNKTIIECSGAARILKVRGGSSFSGKKSDERSRNPIDCTSTFEEPLGEVELAGSSLFNRYFSTCVSLKKRTSALTI